MSVTSDFNKLNLSFAIQSCFIFTFFIMALFAGVGSLASSEGTTINSRGVRWAFLIGLFVIYAMTVLIPVLSIRASPIYHSYDFITAMFIVLITFVGIVLLSFLAFEYTPLSKMLNNSISFSLMMAFYAIRGKKYIQHLNTVFGKVFQYAPSSKSFSLDDPFPFYLLTHYFHWNTLEIDFEKGDSDVLTKFKEFGITKIGNPKEESLKEFKDEIFSLFWMSSFLVHNFALNAALLVCFIVMSINADSG
jgi:hypothetical protein